MHVDLGTWRFIRQNRLGMFCNLFYRMGPEVIYFARRFGNVEIYSTRSFGNVLQFILQDGPRGDLLCTMIWERGDLFDKIGGMFCNLFYRIGPMVIFLHDDLGMWIFIRQNRLETLRFILHDGFERRFTLHGGLGMWRFIVHNGFEK